jgi:hypothetical protein
MAVISGVAVWLSYSTIVEQERPQSYLAQNLIDGSQKFYALSRDGCIGKFETNLQELDQIIQIISIGQLRASYRNNNVDVALRGDFYFNPLGQLQEGGFKVTTDTVTIEASLQDINPIQMKLRAQVAGQEFTRELSLPGPVVVKKSSDGTFHVEQNFPDPSQTSVGVLTASILKPLALQVGATPEIVGQCGNGSEGRLNLTALVEATKASYGDFASMLGVEEN